jgi:hypothetical protein
VIGATFVYLFTLRDGFFATRTHHGFSPNYVPGHFKPTVDRSAIEVCGRSIDVRFGLITGLVRTFGLL